MDLRKQTPTSKYLNCAVVYRIHKKRKYAEGANTNREDDFEGRNIRKRKERIKEFVRRNEILTVGWLHVQSPIPLDNRKIIY